MNSKEQKRIEAILNLLAQSYPFTGTALHYETPFQLLVATILSAQSTDRQVNRVTKKLFSKYPTPQKLAAADLAELEDLIKGCGLFRNKSRSLKKMSQQLLAQYGGQVPPVLEELVKLPGVGRKTANVVLNNAFGIPALAVDTYVSRVAQRLKLTGASHASTIEKELCQKIPQSLWGKAHHWLIAHGRNLCRARSPRCKECLLLKHCPTGKEIIKKGREKIDP
jgi:endonuclease-3